MKQHRFRFLLYLSLFVLLTFALISGCGGTEEADTTEAATETETTAAGTETTAGSTGGTPTGDPIKIGAIVSATGPTSPLGEPERATLLMMQEKVNAEGGLLGRPIEIIIEDDQSNPKEAVTAANKLLQQDKVVAILGSSGSPATLAVKPLTNQAGIPHIALAAANAITDPAEGPIDWIWRAPPRDALAVGKALEYISESMNLTKIAVLHDENAYGSSGAAEIEAKAGDYGLEVVATESYKTEDTDVTAQLTKIRGSNPEVVVVWGTNPGPAVAAKNMTQLGMEQPFVGSHGIANARFIELAGPDAEGVIFPAGRLLVPETYTDQEQKAVAEEFVAMYQEETGQAPPTFAGHAYGGLILLMDAITRADSTEPEAIQAAMNEIQGVITPDGVYNMTETDHDGLSIDDLTVVEIQDGTWVPAE